MIQLTVRQQLVLFNTGVIITLAIVIGAIVHPAIREIRELQKHIRDTHVYLEGRYESVQRSKKTVAALPEIEPVVEVFGKSFVRLGSELSVITQLEALAERNNIDQQLSAIRIEERKNQPNKKNLNKPYYQFSFLNRGTFANQLAYLQGMEEMPYYIKIERMTWEKPQDQAKANTIVVRFDGSIYAIE